jgi:hypothetical protein
VTSLLLALFKFELFLSKIPTSLFFIILLGLENSVDEDATDETSSEFELGLSARHKVKWISLRNTKFKGFFWRRVFPFVFNKA